MAWDIKVPPADVVQASVAATFSIALDKGSAGRFVLSYSDEDGLPFSRPRTFALSTDGVTLMDVDKGQGVNWTPAGDAKQFAAAVAYFTEVVQALIDQGIAAPKR